MSVDSASHYHRLGNVTLADISAGPHEFGILPTALLWPPSIQLNDMENSVKPEGVKT